LDSGKWVAAGETAAWRLKLVSIPILFAILWFGRKLYRSILLQPERFCGLKYARRGLVASATVAMLIALLIGITVPARLEQRKLAKEAAFVRAVRIEQASPSTESNTKLSRRRCRTARTSSDPDGSLAAALKYVDLSTYNATAQVAAVGTEKPRTCVASSFATHRYRPRPTIPTGGLSFTNYQLRLPGEDKIIGTEDDWVVRDGMVMKLSDVSKGSVGRSCRQEPWNHSDFNVVPRPFPQENRRRSLTNRPSLQDGANGRRQNHRRSV
jgi:hypothetical protein